MPRNRVARGLGLEAKLTRFGARRFGRLRRSFGPAALVWLLSLMIVAAGAPPVQASSACALTDPSYSPAVRWGSEAPRLINSADDLIWLSLNQSGNLSQSYLQTAPVIDLGNCVWSPLGVTSAPFTGTYDGGGNTIVNLYTATTSSSPTEPQGMFGAIRSPATIKNLTLHTSGEHARNSINVGGLVGFVGTSTTADLEKIRVFASIRANGLTQDVGTLIGEVDGASTVRILFSSGQGEITSSSSSNQSRFGGLVGRGGAAQITSSYSTASLTFGASAVYVGGLMGQTGNLTLANSYSTASATVSSPSSTQVYGLTRNYIANSGPTSSFWNEDLIVSGTCSPPVTGGFCTLPAQHLGKKTDELKSIDTYLSGGWAIVQDWGIFNPSASIWGICPTVNNGYPFLLWEYTADPCNPVAPGGGSNREPGGGSGRGSEVVKPAIHLDLQAQVSDRVLGAPVLIEGTGLKPGSDYSLVIRSTPMTVKAGVVGSEGSFSHSLAMPSGITPGIHTITLSAVGIDGSDLVLTQSFTVSQEGTFSALGAVTPEVSVGLAATGPDSRVWKLWSASVLLMSIGAALVGLRLRVDRGMEIVEPTIRST